MSGLLGNPGPGALGKVFGAIDKKYESKERPGFSGTRVMRNGQWVSIDRGRSSKRTRARAVLTPLSPL